MSFSPRDSVGGTRKSIDASLLRQHLDSSPQCALGHYGDKDRVPGSLCFSLSHRQKFVIPQVMLTDDHTFYVAALLLQQPLVFQMTFFLN